MTTRHHHSFDDSVVTTNLRATLCSAALLYVTKKLFAVFAGRELAAVDRLFQKSLLSVGPELADVRISLDHRVPKLVLVVTEHFLLFHFLDVDVLHRVTHVVEANRP